MRVYACHSLPSSPAASQVPDEFKQGEVDDAPLSPVGGDIKTALEKGLSRRPDEKELVEVSVSCDGRGLAYDQLMTQFNSPVASVRVLVPGSATGWFSTSQRNIIKGKQWQCLGHSGVRYIVLMHVPFPTDPKIAPSLQAAQADLKRHQLEVPKRLILPAWFRVPMMY